MKSRHLFAPTLAFGCLLAIAGFCPASLFAQEKPIPAKSRPAAAEAPASPRYDIEVVDGDLLLDSLKGRINLDAKYGSGAVSRVQATLRNIVEVLRELHKDANLVMSPGIERIRISDLKLRAATLEQELDALRVASGQKFVWAGRIGQATIDPATGLQVPRMEGRVPLYVLSESPDSAETRRRVEVFNLSDYFNSLDPDTDSRQKLVENSLDEIKKIVVTTIEAVEPESAAVSFQFHSGANLLVVIGSPDALEISRRVINALQTPAGLGMPGFAASFPGGFPGGNPAPANSKNRRNLIARLETIRLESVLYEALPLSEVVSSLIDVTRKRDPEKKGINFLINPNPPSTVGVPAGVDPATGLAIPAEPMDVNQIVVKINPALTNMRLVDVLDAIVRVAEYPIKYTVTDYAVVFSMRSPDEQFGLAQPGIR